MVALHEIVAGKHDPFGLFHATTVPLQDMRRQGLRVNALSSGGVHDFIALLQRRLSSQLERIGTAYPSTSSAYYPLEMSLQEQFAVSPAHYSGIVFAFELSDAKLLANAVSEPVRKARALVDFAKEHAPGVLEGLGRSDGRLMRAVSKELEASDSRPYVMLKLTNIPEDGFFSVLKVPVRSVAGVLRSYERPELRPEARAMYFNGVVPWECLEIVEGFCY